METIFSLSNLLIMPFWFLMIVLPNWRVTKWLLGSPLGPALPAVVYALLVLPEIGNVFAAVSSPSLSGIATLLSTPSGATIAWAHFLAFDLFVGRWAYLDSQARQIHPLLMAPVLFLTLMLGPIGFLLYLVLRQFATRVPTTATPILKGQI